MEDDDKNKNFYQISLLQHHDASFVNLEEPKAPNVPSTPTIPNAPAKSDGVVIKKRKNNYNNPSYQNQKQNQNKKDYRNRPLEMKRNEKPAQNPQPQKNFTKSDNISIQIRKPPNQQNQQNQQNDQIKKALKLNIPDKNEQPQVKTDSETILIQKAPKSDGIIVQKKNKLSLNIQIGKK